MSTLHPYPSFSPLESMPLIVPSASGMAGFFLLSFLYTPSRLKVIGRGHLPETIEALKEHPELKVGLEARTTAGLACQ